MGGGGGKPPANCCKGGIVEQYSMGLFGLGCRTYNNLSNTPTFLLFSLSFTSTNSGKNRRMQDLSDRLSSQISTHANISERRKRNEDIYRKGQFQLEVNLKSCFSKSWDV